MTQILPSIFGLVYGICLIILCVKGKFKIAIPMILLTHLMHSRSRMVQEF